MRAGAEGRAVLRDREWVRFGADFRLERSVRMDDKQTQARVAVVVGFHGESLRRAHSDAIFVDTVEGVHVVVSEIDPNHVSVGAPYVIKRAAIAGVVRVAVCLPTWWTWGFDIRPQNVG